MTNLDWQRFDTFARQAKRRVFGGTRRSAKIARHRGHNAVVQAAGSFRKAARRVWSLRKPIVRWRYRTHRMQEQWGTYREEWKVEREIERAVSGRGPIIVGPWISEVGYEALYWVPFVRWVKAAFRIPPERLFVVSRGGVGSWYADITPNYVEIFDEVSVDEFAARNTERSDSDGTNKQFALSGFDRVLIDRVRARILGADVRVLHPSLMYRLFKQFWSGHRPLEFLDSHTRYVRVAPGSYDLAPLALPPEYVAVKFYAARSLKDMPANRALVRAIVGGIAERRPVVLLDTGLALDNHADYTFEHGSRIVSVRPHLDPRVNLGMQTQIIAGGVRLRRHVRQPGVAGTDARRRHDGRADRRALPALAPACGTAPVSRARCWPLLPARPERARAPWPGAGVTADGRRAAALVVNVLAVAANLASVAANRVSRFRNGVSRFRRHTAKRTKRLLRTGQKRVAAPVHAARRGAADILGAHEPVWRALRRRRKRAERFREHVFDPWMEQRAIERELAALARGRDPIVVGPWLSEVGYEVLYWRPFLTWMADRYRIAPERLIAVSRGGVAGWYEGIAGRYVELLKLFAPDEFAARNAARRGSGDQKQLTPGSFDAEILERISTHCLDGRVPRLCHPSLMFRLFRRFWFGDRSLDFFLNHMRFERLPSPGGDAPDLPKTFAAVKFYTGPAMPDTPEHRIVLRQLVSRVAADMPVVVLDTGLSLDEHRDFLFEGVPNVTPLRARLTPADNLAVQTRMIAQASMFLGTCGSLAWLAPMLGTPTVGVYADDRFLAPHLFVARHAYRLMQAAPFTTLDLRALDTLDLFERTVE